MELKTIIIKENNIKKLYPITLTKPGFEINIGGFTLLSIIKEFFPKTEIIIKARKHLMFNYEKYKEKDVKKDSKDKIIEIDSLTIPSVENMNKIKEEINKTKYNLKNKIKNLEKINYPHEIIILNKQLCKKNLEIIKNKFKKLNNKNVYFGKKVKISKFVEFDTKNGPIIIDDNSSIGSFCFLRGPVYIGKNTKINEHSSIKDNVIIGDVCKIGGEIEESIINSYTNKQHYGYLGNSFLGSWVNLGAGTTTSDLKNTYGFIKVKNGLKNEIKTNQQFLGSILCDYSKSAINTSIYTGKIIGVNSMIYGTIKEDIGSFIIYDAQNIKQKQEFILKKAIETQKRTFKRRDIIQKKEYIKLLETIFQETKKDRINI
jgi:UDP-N-acetylglucosamine diphosphorylase / glucose-1-phosphate thymidylyltransferase / UDP-N-acetylgalactosamine diphosphorylase / glucosamine-1-phosphate N-acetyltransferase / galactosamine-1-phosphate N-acetyltransferase